MLHKNSGHCEERSDEASFASLAMTLYVRQIANMIKTTETNAT